MISSRPSVGRLDEASSMPGLTCQKSKPDSNRLLMHRLPIPKAEPFAISTIVLPYHSPHKDLSPVCWSPPIPLVITNLLLERSAKRPFMNSSTQPCHLPHSSPQMYCKSICIVGRLRRC